MDPETQSERRILIQKGAEERNALEKSKAKENMQEIIEWGGLISCPLSSSDHHSLVI